MNIVSHEVYAFIKNNMLTREQLDIHLNEVNLSQICLRAVFRKHIKKPTYPSYKDYITDKSYWAISYNKIYNYKPIIFPANDSLNIQFINYIWLINKFNTLKIECKLIKPTYLDHDAAVSFNVGGIRVILK